MSKTKKDHPVFETHPGGHKGNPHDIPTAHVPEPGTMMLLLSAITLFLVVALAKRYISR